MKNRSGPWHRRFPLRARIIGAFTLGAIIATLFLVIITYGLSRESMLRQREASSQQQFFANARQVQGALRAEDPDFALILESLPSLSGSRSILRTSENTWVSLSLAPSDLPTLLIDEVKNASTARQMRYRLEGESQLAVGLRLRPSQISTLTDVAYFEITPLSEIESTLESLGLILILGAITTVLIGASAGLWASGRVLSPLTDISTVAQALAKGQFAARVETIDDPDLMPIIKSFNDMAATMEQRIAKDARFASDVSHELRSPLMTLRASIEVMQSRRIELSERASQALDLLADDVNRFEKLVQDLLDLARSNSGSIPSDLVNMTELVEATVAMFEEQPPISILDGANNALVIGDKRRLAQVFDNLLRNAEKYANGATLIEITQSEGRVQISVEDAGPGVSPSERELIFQAFTRGNAAKNRGTGAGAGLGLALVDEHTRRHGGSAKVENRRDGQRGARFTIDLPMVGRR